MGNTNRRKGLSEVQKRLTVAQSAEAVRIVGELHILIEQDRVKRWDLGAELADRVCALAHPGLGHAEYLDERVRTQRFQVVDRRL